MHNYLVLADLPTGEKEKMILLLAAADDGEWCSARDAQWGLCIDWRLPPGHAALSLLPSSPRRRPVSRGAADTSPWTIDLNNESSQAEWHTPKPRTSSVPAKPQRAASPFLNTRTMFLRRQSASTTPRRGRERSDSRRSHASPSSERRVPRSSTTATAAKTASGSPTLSRSAQWVSRLVEDVMTHVARMPAIDSNHTKSVAALTSSVLAARYGALHWRRALNDLAQGLHNYSKVSPICRIFREIFVDDSPHALDDLFLFCQLRQGALRFSTAETQKVLLPPGTAEYNDEMTSLFQQTIVARRYVELRSLTSALSEILTTLILADFRQVGSRRIVRKRRLKPAEIVGVKTIVAYWVQETSSSDSLAFDLPGFVDMYEVLSTILSALGSARRRDEEAAQEQEQQQQQRKDKLEEKRTEQSKHIQQEGHLERSQQTRREVYELPDHYGTTRANSSVEFPLEPTVSYAARANAIMQSKSRTPASSILPSNSPPQQPHTTAALLVQEPDVKVLKPPSRAHNHVPLAKAANNSWSIPPPLRKPAAVAAADAARQIHNAAPPRHHADEVVLEPDETCQDPPKEPPDDPVIVDLGRVLDDKTSSPPREVEPQVQQYFAALAAIDAELQRRRTTLDETAVALNGSRQRGQLQRSPERPPREEVVLAERSLECTPERTRLAMLDDLEEAFESSEPPAVASTFSDVTPPPPPPPPPPPRRTVSILVPPEKRRTQRNRGSARREEEEDDREMVGKKVGVGKEDGTTLSDMEMLTAEERELLADLRRALSGKE